MNIVKFIIGMIVLVLACTVGINFLTFNKTKQSFYEDEEILGI